MISGSLVFSRNLYQLYLQRFELRRLVPCGFCTLTLPNLMYGKHMEWSTEVIYGILGLGVVCKKDCRITFVSFLFVTAYKMVV
jgi:hypothetical protein